MSVPSQEYLKTKVMTASREMLTLMLWDGAIRFAEQGKDAILKKDIEGSYKALLRSQKIITELISTLKHEVNPELCAKLASIYNFIFRRLVDANVSKDAKLVNDAVEIMKMQRETWAMLMEKLAKERAGEAAATQAEAGAAEDAAVGGPASAPVQARPAALPLNPGRRGYPAFAARPAAAAQRISVQG